MNWPYRPSVVLLSHSQKNDNAVLKNGSPYHNIGPTMIQDNLIDSITLEYLYKCYNIIHTVHSLLILLHYVISSLPYSDHFSQFRFCFCFCFCFSIVVSMTYFGKKLKQTTTGHQKPAWAAKCLTITVFLWFNNFPLKPIIYNL